MSKRNKKESYKKTIVINGFTELRVYKHQSNIVCYKKGIFRKQEQSLGY